MISLLIITSVEKLQNRINSVVSSFKNIPGIYVSLNKTQKSIESILKKNKINTNKLFFIDCVTSEKTRDDVLHIVPDPADVSVETGLVKYELLGKEHIDHPTLGFRVGVSTDEVLGVFLVQMLDDRTFKGEVFPRKRASQVTGFTSNAKIYER